MYPDAEAMNIKQKIALIGVATAAIFVAGSGAQTTAMPAVDLSVGPLAVTTQAVNVALALSVEFPTAGAAYRTGTYDHTQEYLGYWDPKGCYQYGDASDTSALTGNYFRRTGSVDSNKYCTGGTSYSGNVLNYAATSSIDLLRYALTGGNRVLDTASQTVLGRAFLPTNFNGIRNASYFPQKEVPSNLVGLVTPQFLTPGGTSNYTGTVYFNSCDDLLLVGNASTGGTCASPGSTNAFGPVIADTSTTYTEQGFTTPPTNTSTTVYVVDPAGKKEWRRTQPQATTTVMPSGSDPNAGTLVPEAVTPPPRNSTVVSTGSTPQRVGDPQVGTIYNPTGNLTTTVPPAGAPDTSPQGTSWIPNVAGADTTPSAAHNVRDGEGLLSELATGSPQTVVHTQNHNVCRSGTTNIRLRLNSSGDNCNGTGGTSSSRSVTTYVMYTQKTLYKEYTTTPVYNYYQEIPTWYEMSLYTIYRVYGTKQVRMKANVQVCDSTEATIRQDSDGAKLCKRYPDDTAGSGNYKPVGELQRKAEGVRVSAFGYAMEDGNGRYGGVLRAPMKFLGNKYRDTSGVIQSNSQAEWDANTGVFIANPLNDATYGISGVANYLNKFGKTGKYKSNDPVGELYYEALRYFQGLQPTSSAVSSLTTAGYDNFPIYTAWTDPVQNACQRRNFILTIGDVNTHYDKQLPGHKSPTGVNETTTDPARAVEAIPGGSSSQTFSAVDWTRLLTGFETGTNLSYTDALGRAQNTLGNPNVVAGNTTLDTKATGSTSSAYYWAGAAYWANTQPIRLDTKTVDGNVQNMKDIRVKTFTIDVDEGGNGSIDANTRGIKPRNSSFFLAGKYGWFNDANEDGNPFKTSGGSVSNKEWEDPVAATIPDGYVLASQAQRMIAGIRKFFGAVSSQSGTISASAVSSQRFTARSPNGDFYSPSFNAGDWSGTVIKSGLKLNATTNAIESLPTVTWDAGQILTAGSVLSSADTSADPYLKPAERKIFTFRRETSGSPGIAFTSANLSQFDAVMQNALNKNPADNSTDSLGEQRVDYLRGVRTQENATTNAFRRRASVMGDIINSGPVFKKEVDENITGDSDYPAFVQSVASRTAVVYVGANDGMLHALRASDGKELFAYVPLAVAANLNRLTNPSYQHTPYVDGVPSVGEAKIGTNWRTVLASGMGGGAQGVFVLDVTNPDHFEDGSTGQGKVLFEFTDLDDPMMGNVLTQPQLVKVKIPASTSGAPPTYQWFVAVSSGYNNYVNDGAGRYQSNGSQAVFFLSLNKAAGAAWAEGTNYFKVAVPANNATTANGLANPGVLLGTQGEVKALYAGDLQGQVWKLDLSEGLSTQNISDGKILRQGTTPMFTATAPSGTRQPITTPPLIANTGQGAHMVVVGTGKFMEKNDASTTGVQSIYGIWDDNGTAAADFGLTRSALAVNSVTEGSTVAIAPPSTSYTLGRGTGQKRGWYFDLAATRERIAVEGAQGFSTITLNSTIPTGDCSGDGDGRSYTLNPVTGIPVIPVDLGTGGGMLGIPIYLSVEMDGGNYSTRYTSGARNFTSAERIISPTTKLTGTNNIAKVKSSQLLQDTVRAGRVSWREVRDFKD
jgi:type IV pilus assembly protein PilY1